MNKLWVRLSLTFSAVILVAVFIVVMASIILGQVNDNHERFTVRFLQQPNGLARQLGDYYQTKQSWKGAESILIGAQSVYFRADAFFLADKQKDIIYFVQADQIGRPLTRLRPDLVLPITSDRQIVGYLGLTRFPKEFPLENRPSPFVRFLGQALLVTAAAGGVGGVAFGVIMSRTLTAPLNNLAEAARAIGARKLNRRVEEKGSAEMVAVARAFNEMAADLEQAEQLRRNLLADVAHELRTPLTILQGNLRAILDEVYPLSQEEMVRLYEHTRFLSRLVNDLHELAQAEARQLPLDLQATELAPLLRSTVDSFRPGAEAQNVTLHCEAPDNLPPLPVDAARLRQILQNLLANALRHTPAGGTITVRAEPEPAGMRLDIIDTGEGILAEHLSHIFDRFYRTDSGRSRDRGGAGLGLAISRALVEAHGGEINVASAGPGQGSTFTIHLPFQ
ncbi:MAG: ATP-binding protein [Chloroflexota bacterium]